MDDRHDPAYARAPEPDDLLRLCRALNDAGARYLLIGGFALIAHGAARFTKDIDFLVDDAPENVARVKLGLAALADNAAADVHDTDVAEHAVVRVVDEVIVGLMGRVCGLSYQDAAADAEQRMIDGVSIPVAARQLSSAPRTHIVHRMRSFAHSWNACCEIARSRVEVKARHASCAASTPIRRGGTRSDMTFTKKLREGIRRGRIRCTVRVWTRPHVKVGGRYRMDDGHVVVDGISPIEIADITYDLARESGFESVDELLQIARHGRGENAFLIRFHYLPPGGWERR